MTQKTQDHIYVYQPLYTGSPIGGTFFFLIGMIGVGLESILFLLGAGSLREASAIGEFIFLLYSFLFMVFGAIILFYKKKYVFNRATQVFTPIVRLPFLSVKLKPVSYQNFDAVQISRKVTGSGKNVGLLFFISLIQDGKPPIILERFFRYSNVKRVGELLAVALMKPLHDMSSGRIVVKQPGEFKTNLQEKLMANTEISEDPLKPRDMETLVTENVGRMQMHIPPFGIIDSLITLLIPSLIIFLFLAWISFMFLQSLPFEIIAYSLTVPTVFIVVAGSYLFREEYVDIDNHDLVVYWTFSGFSGERRIPLSLLEGLYVLGREDDDDKLNFLKALTKTESGERKKDIFYPFRCLSSSITARGPGKSITFGRSLDIEELMYLVFLMETFIKTGTLRRQE